MSRKLYKFHGGIHIEDDNKFVDTKKISTMEDPKVFVVPLKQHIGARSKAIVAIGDKVLQNQLIGQASGNISANVHSPVSGTVIDIAKNPTVNTESFASTCIFVENDFKYNKVASQVLNYDDLSNEIISDRIKSAGLVGLGGAGFPSHIKLKTLVDYFIINAAECEPYISCDDSLMQNYADEIILGIKIVAQVVKPKHILIGIEDNKPNAIKAMQIAAENSNIEVITIPTLYPSGGEKQLIKILTNEDVSKTTIATNIVCYNINTVYQIKKAVLDDQPLTERIVTITGNSCQIKGNYLLKIGTPISHIIEQTSSIDFNQIICGGPLMGFGFNPLDTSLCKAHNCFIIADVEESIHKKPITECIRCGDCVEVCPMQLLPQQLYWYTNDLEKLDYYNIDNCIECGCCDSVCSSNIPLTRYFVAAKAEIRQKHIDNAKSKHAKNRHDRKEARLLRLKKERKIKMALQREAIKKKMAAKKAADKSSSSKNTAEEDKKDLISQAAKRAIAKKTDQSKELSDQKTVAVTKTAVNIDNSPGEANE